ncbi:MAG: extracellular solute-binding protein [Oscillospiraceae bacterium]|nr:extracellular solute-binding protein [Oscillospiraceae bacterium]
MKKVLALALTLLLVFSLVGCGKAQREIVNITLSTEDAEAILAAAGITLPDASLVEAAGKNIKWFAWWDAFHNYSEDEVVNTGFWTFKEKYGCDIEWYECEWQYRFDDLANLILGGTPPDFYPGHTETFPSQCIKGMFQAVNDYIDYDDPLWAGVKEYVDTYFALGDQRYMIVTDASFDRVCGYNRRVMEEWGFDDPAELYYNDEWTWDVFYEMCLDFSDPDEDRYALDGWSYDASIMRSCGQTVVRKNPETGLFESNIDDPSIERAATLIYDLSKNECMYPWWNNGWSIRNGGEGQGLKDGLLLFAIAGTYVFTGTPESNRTFWGEITENELMFVPMPRDPNGDGNYYMESAPAGYVMVKGAENPEGVALFAACERFKVLDPTVVSFDRRQLEEKYLWTEEMLAMWDTCYEIANSGEAMVSYGDGLGAQLASTVSALESNGHSQDAATWAQLKESHTESLIYYIDELNSTMQELS